VSKNSKYGYLFPESRSWWDCGNKAILNGLMRAGRKTGNCRVIPDGIFIRYQGSIYDSIWNKWVIFTKPGGTAEANNAFVPVIY